MHITLHLRKPDYLTLLGGVTVLLGMLAVASPATAGSPKASTNSSLSGVQAATQAATQSAIRDARDDAWRRTRAAQARAGNRLSRVRAERYTR